MSGQDAEDKQVEKRDKVEKMNYGDLAFWMYLVKRQEGLQGDMPPEEFHNFLLINKDKSLVLMDVTNEPAKDSPARDSSQCSRG